MQRGILVDFDGYFLAAYEWDETSADDAVLNYVRKYQGPKRRSDKPDARYILTDEAAIADPQPNGRWDFNTKAWLAPTEQYQIVRQRRDAPRYWTHSGSRKVWPDRLPRLPAGAKWIFAAPPSVERSRKWIWDDEAGNYILPEIRAHVDASGNVVNLASVLPGAKPGKRGEKFVDPASIEVEDETGEKRSLTTGDKIDKSGAVVEAAVPTYSAIPVRLLERALDDAKLAGAFVSFVESKGYSIEQVRELEAISLGNKVLREFVTSQGFTMKQAYTSIQKKAEKLQKDEAVSRGELRENVNNARN